MILPPESHEVPSNDNILNADTVDLDGQLLGGIS
jgi:hypothetical protein